MMQRIFIFGKTQATVLLLIFFFLAHFFLRFYQLQERGVFGWDQVDGAWAVKYIIVDHHFPLVGTQEKGNSGIHIGPLYYYYLVPFYLLTNLDPLASPIAASVTSVFSFFILFFLVKKLCGTKIAFIALFINTLSWYSTMHDRNQWPVDFVPLLSFLIFYFLYKAITDKPINFIPLGICVGLAWQAHFTAVFFPVIILLSLPWVKWNKQVIRSVVVGFFHVFFFSYLM